LDYSTFLGGTKGEYPTNNISAIEVDNNKYAYVTGRTTTTDFPTTKGSYVDTYKGSGGFITKINNDGSGLVFSTIITGVSLWILQLMLR